MARKLVIDINYPSQPPDKPDTKTKMRPTVAEANRLLEHGTLGDAKTADYGVRGMKKGVRKAAPATGARPSGAAKKAASGAKPAGAASGNSDAPPHAKRHKELLSRGFKYVGGGRYNNPKEPAHPIFVNGAGEWTY